VTAVGIALFASPADAETIPERLMADITGDSYVQEALLHKRVRNSCGESSVVAGLHEQPYTSNLQDQELAGLQ
jgi:hypothetical protein